MRRRFTWIVAILALVGAAALVACSTKYSSSSNGLIVVPTQGSAVMQSFSLDLANGHVSQINNQNGPPTAGIPTSVILDPAGTHAYVIVYQNAAVAGSVTGIEEYPIGSDGKLGSGTTTTLNNSVLVGATCESVSLTPIALAVDATGKLLFVANNATTDASQNLVPGSVSVFAIGSNGALTEANPFSCTNPTVVGSPYPLPIQSGGGNPNPSALAVTRTIYPALFAACSNGQTPPATEYLYVADSVNDVLLNYSVSSTGALSLNPTPTGNGIPTGAGPAGVAVDPCNRFAFVANSTSNNVSAYTICNIASATCAVDFHLTEVGSPIGAGDAPGPIAVDPYGNFLYVVDTGSDQVSAYRISAATGSLTAEGTAATNLGPTSIAIRSDEAWVFVANLTSGNISQYGITQSSGALNPVGPVTTFNLPSGVAVK